MRDNSNRILKTGVYPHVASNLKKLRKITEFEFVDESAKAWQIAKSFEEYSTYSYRWIPKSVSQMEDNKKTIYIQEWFFKVWMKELKEIDNENEEFEKAIIEQKKSRKLFINSELHNKAKEFVDTRIPDEVLSYEKSKNLLSNTRTIFYLGEFAKSIFTESSLRIDSVIQIRLQELLVEDIYYEKAMRYKQSSRTLYNIDTKMELSFVMVEYVNWIKTL